MFTIVQNVLALYEVNLVYLCGKFSATWEAIHVDFPSQKYVFWLFQHHMSSAATDCNNNIQVCRLSNTYKNHCPRGIPWKIYVHHKHISIISWTMNTDSLLGGAFKY